MTTFLDGALGTELDLRGVKTDSRAWSTPALLTNPDAIQQIHREYAAAGATIHTTNTFRTQRRTIGEDWADLTRIAVELARSSVPGDHRIAGSIAPLEDCYRPELSPNRPEAEHREMAECLVDAGCDLLLVETFAHIGEATAAVSEAARTGKETWLSLTAGPNGDLLTPDEMVEGARRAVDQGVQAILVNCVAAADTLRFVRAIADAKLNVPFGAYANAGDSDDEIGWRPVDDPSLQPGVTQYLRLAREWVDAGATLIGGCCGVGPKHIATLAEQLV